jgi:RND family efflux transporter MFP subunit
MKNYFTRYAGIIIGILVAAIVFFLASCSGDDKASGLRKEKPVSVQVRTATQRMVDVINVSGQIESQETAAISTRIMGFISSVTVNPGDRVQKGQLLATINNRDILAKRAQAEAMVSESEATLADAKKDYERFEELYRKQSASEKELENATLRYNSVKAKTEAAKEMKNEANAMLIYTNLVAPFSGVVVQKNNDEGSMANPGVPILIIEKSGSYLVKAFVSENEVGNLSVGTNAMVTIKSTGKKILAKVIEISPSSQFSGGQFQIKLDASVLENKGLYSGMYVNVSVYSKTDSGTESLFVPVSALVHKDQLSGLYTISDDQTAQLRWLKVGKTVGDEVEILSGLNQHEKFIAETDGRLYSGVSVVVK